ncbi:hypothetical protein AMTR_s00074p00186100 [Amborella trichopoda]|uniref:Uncharacterized protein n=1 Tax=Amborella trichopoda TaxID=13333 RepID=W1NN14_AMBTC|nr:hypothetical protein AMTR_s00074p00186100 [Amborella trichopoda]
MVRLLVGQESFPVKISTESKDALQAKPVFAAAGIASDAIDDWQKLSHQQLKFLVMGSSFTINPRRRRCRNYRRCYRKFQNSNSAKIWVPVGHFTKVLGIMASKVTTIGIPTTSPACCGLTGVGVCAASPAKHDLTVLMASDEDLLLFGAPPKVLDYVEACLLLTLCCSLGKQSKLFPFQHHVKEAVALDNYTRLCAVRKGCSSKRHVFDPLMVVLDEDVGGLNVEDGDFFPEHGELSDLLMEEDEVLPKQMVHDDNEGTIFDEGGVDEFGQALVAVDASTPVNCLLKLPPLGVVHECQISSIVSDSGMDFFIPTRIVFRELLKNKKVEVNGKGKKTEVSGKLKMDMATEGQVNVALVKQTLRMEGVNLRQKAKLRWNEPSPRLGFTLVALHVRTQLLEEW